MSNRLSQRISQIYIDLDEGLSPIDSPASSDDSLNEHELAQRVRSLTLTQPNNIEDYKQMTVILIQTAAGLKPPSGGFRGNYATLLALAKHGHVAIQTCWAFKNDINEAISELRQQDKWVKENFSWGYVYLPDEDMKVIKVTWWKFINVHGITCISLDADTMIKAYHNGLQQKDAATWIETGKCPERAQAYAGWLTKHITEANPTHVLFNDAFASKVTEVMTEQRKTISRVEIVHTLEQLPFGPFAGGISGGAMSKAELPLFQQLDGLVGVSRSMVKYAKKYGDLDLEMIPNHAWSYKDKNTGGWPRYRQNFSKQNVVMINPAYVKGYDIFLGMARANKQRAVENEWDELLGHQVYNFVAYSSWGSNAAMTKDLKDVGVKMLDSVTDMEPAYDNISVLIVPSLWQEAWGLIATEAQLRGIPVISSDAGGLPEAKRYVGPIIPVNAIDGTKRNEDGSYVIPEQDIRPWMKELDMLLGDKDRYESVSHAAYYTTRQWIRQFDVRGMEKYLLSIAK